MVPMIAASLTPPNPIAGTWAVKPLPGVSLAVPIRDANDKVIGVAGTDIILTQLSDYLGSIKPLGSGTVQLISQQGKWIAHSDSTLLGKDWKDGRSAEDLTHQTALFDAIKSGKPINFEGYSNTLGTEVIRFVDPVPVGDTGNSLALIVSIPVRQRLRSQPSDYQCLL